MLLVIISWEFMFRIWCLNYYSTSALRCGCRASYASCEKDRCEFELERNVQRCSLAIPDLSAAAHTANMSFTLRGKLAFMFFWKWWKSSRLLKASKSRYVNSFIFFFLSNILRLQWSFFVIAWAMLNNDGNLFLLHNSTTGTSNKSWRIDADVNWLKVVLCKFSSYT